MNCLYCSNEVIEAHQLCSMHYQRWRHRRPMEIEKVPKGWLQDGYKKICVPGGREMPEHRYIVELTIGRQLHKNEYVHHKNHIKNDNRLENLEIMSPAEHTRLHCSKTPIQRSCLNCGIDFLILSKQNNLKQETCSHKCGTTLFWKRRRKED